MGIKILKEDAQSRTVGYPIKSGEEIYPANGVVLELNALTLKPEVRAWAAGDRGVLRLLGLAIDSNVMFPVAPSAGDPHTVGEGYDFTNYNRGGLLSAIRQATVVVFDDKRSANSNPFDAAAAFTVLSAPVYLNDSNLITHDSTDAVEIGTLEDFVLDGVTLISATIRVNIV